MVVGRNSVLAYCAEWLHMRRNTAEYRLFRPWMPSVTPPDGICNPVRNVLCNDNRSAAGLVYVKMRIAASFPSRLPLMQGFPFVPQQGGQYILDDPALAGFDLNFDRHARAQEHVLAFDRK